MKSNEKKILYLLVIMFLFMLFNTFFYRIFNYTNLTYIAFWILSFITLFGMVGYKKDNYIYKIDNIQVIIIYSFVYLITIYLSGLFFGYLRSPYSLEVVKIIKNIASPLIIIIVQELFRFDILKKTKNKFLISFLFILFVSFDVTLGMKHYSLVSTLDYFNLIGNLIIPSIVNNLLFMYASYNGSIWVALIYRLIFELYFYFVPIVPDLGTYFEAILSIAFPTIIFLRFNTMYAKKKPINHRNKKFVSILITAPILSILFLVIALSSNNFSHSALAIGSNSMYPKIKKGDIVIVEKENFDTYKIDDILVFKHDGKIIVHRIIDINYDKNKIIFNTKGDNNSSKDNYTVISDNVIGRVNVIVPYIGYPSVWLTEKIS